MSFRFASPVRAVIVSFLVTQLAACVADEDDELFSDQQEIDFDIGPAPGPVALPQARFIDVAGAAAATCALYSDGKLWCAGRLATSASATANFSSPTAITGAINASTLSGTASNFHFAATADRVVRRVTTVTGAPATVSNLTGVTRVATGTSHACALRSGQVYCWGDNAKHQLGSSTLASSMNPILVPGIGNAVDIAAGNAATCVVRSDLTVWCWGDGKPGLGAGATPRKVLGSMVRVEMRHEAACALSSLQRVSCWGSNVSGQLNIGSTDTIAHPPVGIALTGVTDLDVGNGHICAITSGSLKCWGSNFSGQLGNGTTATWLGRVTAILPRPALRVRLGDQHSCAILDDESLWCWGANGNGQLGLGSAAATTVDTPLKSGF